MDLGMIDQPRPGTGIGTTCQIGKGITPLTPATRTADPVRGEAPLLRSPCQSPLSSGRLQRCATAPRAVSLLDPLSPPSSHMLLRTAVYRQSPLPARCPRQYQGK